MLNYSDIQDIRHIVHDEVLVTERELLYRAGSYHYICDFGSGPVYTHVPVGRVLRHI